MSVKMWVVSSSWMEVRNKVVEIKAVTVVHLRRTWQNSWLCPGTLWKTKAKNG